MRALNYCPASTQLSRAQGDHDTLGGCNFRGFFAGRLTQAPRISKAQASETSWGDAFGILRLLSPSASLSLLAFSQAVDGSPLMAQAKSHHVAAGAFQCWLKRSLPSLRVGRSPGQRAPCRPAATVGRQATNLAELRRIQVPIVTRFMLINQARRLSLRTFSLRQKLQQFFCESGVIRRLCGESARQVVPRAPRREKPTAPCARHAAPSYPSLLNLNGGPCRSMLDGQRMPLCIGHSQLPPPK